MIYFGHFDVICRCLSFSHLSYVSAKAPRACRGVKPLQAMSLPLKLSRFDYLPFCRSRNAGPPATGRVPASLSPAK